MKTLTVLLAFVACAAAPHAQMTIGGWQTAFAYNGIETLTQSPEKVYAVSSGNLFSVDKTYNSVETYSKITGLSSGDIVLCEYDEDRELLFLVYSDYGIDLVDKDGAATYMTDLKRKEISNKTVNNVSFDGRYAYLSCGFGIVVIDLMKREVADTYIIGDSGGYLPVYQTVASQDSLYALTDEFLCSASLKNDNKADYNVWKKRALPPSEHGLRNMAYFGGRVNLFLDGYFTLESDGWKDRTVDGLRRTDKIHTYGGQLTAVSTAYSSLAVIDENFARTVVRTVQLNDCVFDPRKKEIWVARDSLKKYDGETFAVQDTYLPNGPNTNNIYFMRFDQGKLISGFGPGYGDRGIVQVYDGQEWVNITQSSIKDPDGRSHFLTVNDAVLDPKDSRRMYVGTWRSLYEFYDNQYVGRKTTGTALDPVDASATDPLIEVQKLQYDSDGTLWLLNTQGGNLIKAMDADGGWHSLYHREVYRPEWGALDFLIDHYGMKWITFPRGGVGLFVQYGGKTPFSAGDDQTRFFTSINISDGSTFSPAAFYCVAEDKEHNVWVGTDAGPVVFRNTSGVFDSRYAAYRVKIVREDDNSLADYLLSTEQINSICVDGANRKWIATAGSGVYLLSPSGEETVAHFTTENSPLTTNVITKLALDPQSGKVYIGTPKGMFIYQSDAADGVKTLDEDAVHVYPNPVYPDYDGVVTVTNLMEDTEVRITDVEGHVVAHGLSNGRMFTWDCRLASGRRAQTGVYYVYAITQDGENKCVTKFAIIKK